MTTGVYTVCLCINRNKEHESTTHLFLRFFFSEGNSNKALANELVFFLTGPSGQGLFHDLSTTGTPTAGGLEFAHIVTITLDLFFLGINTAREQGTKTCASLKVQVRRKCL